MVLSSKVRPVILNEAKDPGGVAITRQVFSEFFTEFTLSEAERVQHDECSLYGDRELALTVASQTVELRAKAS